MLNKIKLGKKNPFLIYLIIFIFLYALFAFERMKEIASFNVEGFAVTNELWIIPFSLFLFYFFKKRNPGSISIRKVNLIFIVLVFFYVINILIGGMNLDSYAQYFYASALFLVPMLLYLPTSRLNGNSIIFFFRFLVVTCLIYAILSIVLATNYAYFMNLVGNPTDDYRYYSHFRASMMLGSSITVSYYFNLTLPICFYLFYKSKERKWRIISAVTIAFNVIATFLLLSRAASIISILIVTTYLLIISGGKRGYGKKILIVFTMLITLLYAFLNFDLSRITMGFDYNSTEGRFLAAKLGLYIFTQFPIFGSGVGRFFERAYDYRYIEVDGITGLIDPHNLYILILSELGFVGIFLTISMFIYLFTKFKFIKDKVLRKTAMLTIFSFAIGAFGGSQLMNEISFATVFWIYMGLFNAVSINDRFLSTNNGDTQNE